MPEKNIILPENLTLKCDAEPCDFTNTVKVKDMPDWINIPCPKCGANLLTYEDFVLAQKAMASADLVNELSKEELEIIHNGIMNTPGNEELKEMIKEFAPDERVVMKVSAHKEIKIEGLEKIPPQSS